MKFLRIILALLLCAHPLATTAQTTNPPFSSFNLSQQNNISTLRGTLTKLASMVTASPSSLRIVTWGDSTGEFHAAPLVATLAQLYPPSTTASAANALAGVYGCTGVLPTGQSLPCLTTATSGSVTTVTADFTQSPTSNYWVVGVGGCVTFMVNSGPVNANKMSIFYIKQNGAGTLTLNTNLNNGGFTSAATANAQNSTAIGAVLTVTEGGVGSYTMQACASGAGPVTVFTGGFENTTVNGVVLLTLDEPGASLTQMNSTPTALTAPWYSFFAPDLITFEMKQNSGGWQQADLNTWLSNWQTANPLIDLLMIGSYPIEGSETQIQNQNSMMQAAALANNGVYWDGFYPAVNYATAVSLGWITNASSPHQTTLGQLATSLQFLNYVGIIGLVGSTVFNNVSNTSVTSNTFMAYNPTTGGTDLVGYSAKTGASGSKVGSIMWANDTFGGPNLTCIADFSNQSAMRLYSNGGTQRLHIGCDNGYMALGANDAPNDFLDLSSAGGVILKTTTVGSLPTCNTAHKGDLYGVSDASSPTYNATLTGGSSTYAMALCNGSAWTAH